MAGFIYSFPGEGICDQTLIDECGLSGVIDLDHLASTNARTPGPGADGVLVCTDPNARLAYKPDAQTWTEGRDGKFWLGFDTDARPGPADLARANTVNGIPVELDDGNRWVIPAAKVNRPGSRTTMLDEALTLAPDGSRVRSIVPRHQSLADIADAVFDTLVGPFVGNGPGEDAPTLTDEDFAWDACIAALTTNYRVSQWEVSALSLLTTENQPDVLFALVDYGSWLRANPTLVESARTVSEVE